MYPKSMLSLLCFLLLLPTSISYAQKDSDSDAPEEDPWAKVVELGPGVHMIQKDKKGRITSCVVVGQSRISTVLGKSKGLETARDKANLACAAEFVKWLKEDVNVYTSNEDETVTLMEGEESEENESLAESGKSVEKNSKKMESVSKGLVRGLQVLHKQVDGDGKTYTLVKGWKADTAEGVKKIAADMESDDPSEKGKKNDSSRTGESGKGNKGKNIDKEIESGSATSDDAESFLPKKKKK